MWPECAQLVDIYRPSGVKLARQLEATGGVAGTHRFLFGDKGRRMGGRFWGMERHDIEQF